MRDNNRTNYSSLSDRLVFEGEVATKKSHDKIIFPDDYEFNVLNTSNGNIINDNEIDLSGSFKVTRTTTTTTLTPPISPLNLNYNLNAFCNSYAQFRMLVELNANSSSGVYTFPNGTQITFARCEVVLIKHPDWKFSTASLPPLNLFSRLITILCTFKKKKAT